MKYHQVKSKIVKTRIVLLFVLCWFSTNAFSQQFLVIKFKDGHEQAIPLADIDKIDFRQSGGNETQPIPTSRPNLSGVWYDYSASSGNSGLVCKITQTGEKLVFTNPANNQSEGNFLDNSTIVAAGWEGGLKATLENGGRRIVWKNGSVWERNLRPNPPTSRPNLTGIWYDYSAWSGNSGLICKITQSGEKLVFTNPSNDQSEGNFLDNSTIIATGWQGGLKATLEDEGRRINWKNGSVWQRSKR
jgi:hypothetical protein